MKLDKDLDPQKEGFANTYQSIIDEFNKKKANEYNLQELINWYRQFNESFLYINRKYAIYSEKTLSDIQNMEYKINFEVAGVYISQIQNRFLNPINNEINRIQIEESLIKADNSIKIGKKSVRWAIIAFVVTIIFSVLAFLDIKYPLKKIVSIVTENKIDSTKHIKSKLEQPEKNIKNSCADTMKITK